MNLIRWEPFAGLDDLLLYCRGFSVGGPERQFAEQNMEWAPSVDISENYRTPDPGDAASC